MLQWHHLGILYQLSNFSNLQLLLICNVCAFTFLSTFSACDKTYNIVRKDEMCVILHFYQHLVHVNKHITLLRKMKNISIVNVYLFVCSCIVSFSWSYWCILFMLIHIWCIYMKIYCNLIVSINLNCKCIKASCIPM
jgi:hypothetical protein